MCTPIEAFSVYSYSNFALQKVGPWSLIIIKEKSIVEDNSGIFSVWLTRQ